MAAPAVLVKSRFSGSTANPTTSDVSVAPPPVAVEPALHAARRSATGTAITFNRRFENVAGIAYLLEVGSLVSTEALRSVVVAVPPRSGVWVAGSRKVSATAD